MYASTREEETQLVPWSEDQKRQFLEFQFQAQHTHYQQHFPDASYDLILLDGQPAGRLYVDRNSDEIRILDIALLPEYRGQGIGTRVLNEIREEAAAARLPIRIHVEQNNPALNLYKRLGFQQLEAKGVYWVHGVQSVKSVHS